MGYHVELNGILIRISNIHMYMKNHYCGSVSLGKGAMQINPIKQKLNRWISTESEIVGVDNHMCGILFSMKLFQSQVYRTEYNIIYQCNQISTIMKKLWILMWWEDDTYRHSVFLSLTKYIGRKSALITDPQRRLLCVSLESLYMFPYFENFIIELLT